MARTCRLSELIEEVLVMMEAQGATRGTIRSARATYDRFLGEVGNIQLKYLTSRHVDDFFLNCQRRGESHNTLNLRRNWLRKLSDLGRRRRFLTTDPVGHVRPFRGVPKSRLRIPVEKFPALLEAAHDPVERIVIALGLYQFHRGGEIAALRIRDVDLAGPIPRISKINFKSKKLDRLPISTELDQELRRWFLAYQEDQGRPLDPEWYLCPARKKPHPVRLPGGRYTVVYPGVGGIYRPNRPIAQPHNVAKRVLERAGYSVRDEVGTSNREGVHTLRRSGARAFYDRLRTDTTHDDANRTVQAMLGHATFATTEVYLGIDIDRSKRDELIAGKPMFPAGDNVILMPHREESTGGW